MPILGRLTYSLIKEKKMSNLLKVFDGFDQFNRTAIGFERLFDDMLRVNSVQVQQKLSTI
jgi:hypothetical protein